LFIYLREREHKQEGGTEREREGDSLPSREPDAELDPKTPRS